MEFDEAFKIADTLVLAETGQHLTNVQRALLWGAWQGQTYHEIAEASGYSATYLNQELGPQLWKLLSEIFGESVSKKNVRAILERQRPPTFAALKTKEAVVMVPKEFQALIEEKTQDFVGREYVFTAIETFLQQNSKGYFTIIGDPGVGKSTILAEYVRRTGCVAHFNIISQGINRVDQFLASVCTQLIARYKLPYPTLPDDSTRDGEFLAQLLAEVSAQLGEGERLIVAIDALDEVDLTNQDRSANILYLPAYLPNGVYFLLTHRPKPLPLMVFTPQHQLELNAYPDFNFRDVQTYIQRATERSHLRQWIEKQGLSLEEFVSQLANLSENNFMYLRYVLGDIESGLYQDLSIEMLPQGLTNYYEHHWRRMGMNAQYTPHSKIKIVYILSEVIQPVSLELIAKFANEDQLTVQMVVNEWLEFLRKHNIDGKSHYSLYHASFRDFLHQQDIVQAAGMTIPSIHAQIAATLWQELYENE